jgi:hypothetical protein
MHRNRLLGIASIPLSVIIVLSFCKGVDAFLNKEWVTPSEGNLQTERTSGENKIDEVITITPEVTQEEVKGLYEKADVVYLKQEEEYPLPTQNIISYQAVAKCSEEDIKKVEDAIVISYTNIQFYETDKKNHFDDCKAYAWDVYNEQINELNSGGNNARSMSPEARMLARQSYQLSLDKSLAICQNLYDEGIWNKEIDAQMKVIRNAEQWLADCE